MATYTMSADYADRLARGLKRARSMRVWVLIASVSLISCLIYARMRWGLSEHLFTLILIACFGSTVQLLRLNWWKKPAEAAIAIVQVQSLEIDSDQVRSENGEWSRSLRKDEITRAEEPHGGLGLYLRTSNPFRWLLIPKGINGYEEIRSGLAASAVPVRQTRFSPQSVDFLLFLAVMGLLITELIVRSHEILLVSLAVSVVVFAIGIFAARGRADSRKLKLQYGFFYSLPLIFAILFWHLHF